MASKASKNFNVSHEYIEKAIAYVMAKTEFWSCENTLFMSLNPEFNRNSEPDDFKYSDFAGYHFDFKEWYPTVTQLIRITRPDQLLTAYSFQFVEKLDEQNRYWVIPASEANSSWADEGYIVTTCFSKAFDFRKEIHHQLKRNGVGLIYVNPTNYLKSRLIYPARPHNKRCQYAFERIMRLSEGFRKFAREIDVCLRAIEE